MRGGRRVGFRETGMEGQLLRLWVCSLLLPTGRLSFFVMKKMAVPAS